MRLLNVHTLVLKEFDENPANYAIASHRWIRGEEATFEQFNRNPAPGDIDKSGYKKVVGFATFVKAHIPHVDWIWIDTCCIDEGRSSEVEREINSMHKRYRNAEVCLAYLADVRKDDPKSFQQSEWFRRGWTLQELLLPRTVVFLAHDWTVIGYKGETGRGKSGIALESGSSLNMALVAATGIPHGVLNNFEQSKGFTVDERLEWTKGRNTTHEEDMSYCLLGIFQVHMSLIYGEGHDKARWRLLKKIHKATDHYKLHTPSAIEPIQTSDEFDRVVNWLSPPDPRSNHRSARQQHEADTGTWFLESEDYKRWRGEESGHLWLFGPPGTGKTIICSSVIEEIQAYCKVAANTAHAMFYFSFSDIKKQSYKNLLCSLVEQLTKCNTGPGWLKLKEIYRKIQPSPPGLADLEEVVHLLFESYETVYLLLDALDECPEGGKGDSREEVLHFLVELSKTTSNLKIFATSRALLDIQAFAIDIAADRMALATHSVSDDINKYISATMARDLRLNRFSEGMKSLVTETLSQKAHGMFRWVHCQLQELKKLRSTRPTKVKEVLSRLPVSLDETYERMLASIDESHRKEAFTLLQWLAYAKGPMNLQQLAEVLIINPDDNTVDTDDRGNVEDTLDILAGMVTIGIPGEDTDIIQRSNGGKTLVTLAHYSVQEYLESDRLANSRMKHFHLKKTESHKDLARSCLAYLMHLSRMSMMETKGEYDETRPMLWYATHSWVYHSIQQGHGDVSRQVLFLRHDCARRDWLLAYNLHRQQTLGYHSSSTEGSALYWASELGLEAVVIALLELGLDVNAEGGYCHTVLMIACWNNQTVIVKHLIDAGACVNAQGGDFGNALNAASLRGSEKIVELLLDAGADVNAQDSDGGTPLAKSSLAGNENIVKLLLAAGADVNATSGRHFSALTAAALRGGPGVVKLLVHAGADVNIPWESCYYGVCLWCQIGFEEAKKMLASTGADDDTPGFGKFCCTCHEEVVKILRDAGADVNVSTFSDGVSLYSAAKYGYEEIARKLLEAGADANDQGGVFDNALQGAASQGSETLVNLLLDAGATFDVHGEGFGFALWQAVSQNHPMMVKLLLDAGAQANAPLEYYDNALHAALLYGEDVYAFRRKRRRQTAEDGYTFWYECEIQALDGRETMVNLLLDAGADVNAPIESGGTVLQAAAKAGDESMVKLLLSAGADVNAEGGEFGNALQAATKGPCPEKIVAILLDAGANECADIHNLLLEDEIYDVE